MRWVFLTSAALEMIDMTDKQPEALQLADQLERMSLSTKWDKKAADELRRLHQCCRDIYEVWVGSEGIPEPQTAAEAYLLSLVEQMRDIAKEGLK